MCILYGLFFAPEPTRGRWTLREGIEAVLLHLTLHAEDMRMDMMVLTPNCVVGTFHRASPETSCNLSGILIPRGDPESPSRDQNPKNPGVA